MPPSPEPEEFELPTQSLRGRAAGTIERICVTTARWSVPLILPIGGSFIVYLLGGYGAISLGIWSPSYEFLSLTEDIYFAWFGFLSGTVICMGTGSLIGLAFLREGEQGRSNQISILFAFVGFGFGAGVLRMTYMTVLSTLF